MYAENCTTPMKLRKKSVERHTVFMNKRKKYVNSSQIGV